MMLLAPSSFLSKSVAVLSLTSIAMFFAFSPSLVFAQDISSERVIPLEKEGQRYSPMKILESPMPEYPTTSRRERIENYIEVLYDVGPDGKAKNLRFNRTVGRENFEVLIDRKFRKWRFEPAMIDGKPITQKNNRRVFAYSLTELANRYPEPRMRRKLKTLYNKLVVKLKDGEYDYVSSALEEVSKVPKIRFTENRGFQLLQATYLKRTNGPIVDRILALETALRDAPKIEKSIKLNTRIKGNLFRLYVANKQYLQALQTYSDIQRSQFSEELVIELGPLVDEAESALVSGEPLATSFKTDEGGFIWYPLSRQRFRLNSDMSLSFIELRCKDFNVTTEYVPDAIYELPFDWKNCRIWALAEPWATFSVEESSPL